MSSKDVALVIQGGGSRGIFCAGVLDVFLEKKISFPYVIGTSAGGLTGFEYLAGDHGRAKEVVLFCAKDDTFASPMNFLRDGNFMDLDYLFFTCQKLVSPVKMKTFEKNPARFLVAATDCRTGGPIYFEKGVTRDFIKMMKATCSLPLITRHPVMVDGIPCLDGWAKSAIPFEKAFEDGYQKIVVISTRNKDFRKNLKQKPAEIALCKRMYREYPNVAKAYRDEAKVYNEQVNRLWELEKEGKAFIIAPERPVEVGRATKNQKKLLDFYEEGRAMALKALDELKRYLGE